MSGRPAPPALLDEDALALRFAELLEPPRPPLVLGLGDDAAVLRLDPGEDLVWTVDALEEDVDFRREWLDAGGIGSRAVAATLSDIAAMGGRPLAVLLALASADPEPAAELLELFTGAARAAGRWGAVVAGGDVGRRRAGTGVYVTALGAVPHGEAWTRGGARPGDELWVTGRLGLARAGLRLLRELGKERATREAPDAVSRFLDPFPRLDEAAWLRDRVPVRACIDLSDGLARDLPRLCAASGVGARLDGAAVRSVSAEGGASGVREALLGGEDFELLLALPPGALRGAGSEFVRRFGLPLTRVGETLRERRITIRGPAGEEPLPAGGWDHLARDAD